MKKSSWLVALLVAAILALFIGRAVHKRAAERKAEAEATSARALPVQTARVELGDVEATIETSGTVVVREEADIVAKVPGRVASVSVDESETVRAGQVVVKLEQDDILAQVAQAKAAVQGAEAGRGGARAQLTAIRTGARTQERRQAENAVAQARANLENARSTYERMRDLFDLGAISRQQMDLVQMQYDVARAQYDSAQEQLSLVDEGARAEDIQAAEQRLKQAEAGVAQARAALQLAQVQLANTLIRSPVSGRVSLRSIEPGEMAAPGVPLLHIVNNQTAYLEVAVSDARIGRIRRGMEASITVDGIPGDTFRGRVTEINPVADPASRASRVKISVEGPSAEIRPGMFARVALTTERREGVVVVPRHVLVRQGDDDCVMLRDGDVARARGVTLGLGDQTRVEIVTGLRTGEEIVVVGQELLEDGDTIQVGSDGENR